MHHGLLNTSAKAGNLRQARSGSVDTGHIDRCGLAVAVLIAQRDACMPVYHDGMVVCAAVRNVAQDSRQGGRSARLVEVRPGSETARDGAPLLLPVMHI